MLAINGTAKAFLKLAVEVMLAYATAPYLIRRYIPAHDQKHLQDGEDHKELKEQVGCIQRQVDYIGGQVDVLVKRPPTMPHSH